MSQAGRKKGRMKENERRMFVWEKKIGEKMFKFV